MASIGLGFTLSANAQGMSSGINAGVVELQKLGYAAKKTQQDISTLKTIEIGRAFVSAAQAVTGTFTRFTSGAASAIDSTVKLSRSLGISYQELRALQLAANLSGSSSEQLATAFTRAQVAITKAGQGSKESVTALKTLGLAVEDLAGKSATDQFSLLAGAISRIQDPAQRAAAAVAIFGRSGAQLLPVFQGLPVSLKQAQGFLDQFKGGLTDVEAGRVEEVNDAFTLAGEAVKELAGKILAQLQPALQQGAERFVRFVSAFDVSAAASAVESALSDVVSMLGALGQVAGPLARNIFPAIGGSLAFINRQAISAGIVGLARVFASAASAALGYAGAAATAATATAALAASARALLVSTGIGAVVVLLGVAAGAAVDFAAGGQQAGADVQGAVQAAIPPIQQAKAGFDAAAAAAANFGEEAARALKVPQEITATEFAQGSLDEARSAIVSLGRELGGLNQVPQGVLQSFSEISKYAGEIDSQIHNQAQAIRIVNEESGKIVATVRQITDARKAEAEATKNAADQTRRAAEDASRDARSRVQGLIESGLPESEKSRLTLSQDLLAINRTIAEAEKNLADARKAGDAVAIQQAQERLRLTQETAAAATDAARQQARDRELSALGLDRALLKPVETVKDQFVKVRQAFDKGLVSGGEAGAALRNLAAEGISIRKEIAMELAKPSQQALQVSDIRTQEGASQFLAMATGRQDPALEQRAQQLAKLEEIRKALIAVGANPVDILGA